jgi:hypothetical protein
MKKIECKYCGWSWNESDGGDDKYMCHMCDNDNSKHYLKESEQSKKGKLFIPRRLSGGNSRFIQWNKEQPIVDGVQINQYTHDGKPIGYWDNWVDDDDIMVGKGTFVKGVKNGYWEEYLDGELVGKGIYKNGKESGIWEFYEDGEVYRKELFQSGKLVGKWYPSKDTLTESEQSKKGKLFIPRRIEGRWDDYLKSTITTDYNIGPYLKRRDLYKDNSKNIDPLVMKLSKGDLITFVKSNPFWLNSLDKVEYLLNILNYKENKDIAENHIGQTFAKSKFWTSPEMNYYEMKFEIPKSNYGKIDIYVFVGSDEFVETRGGSYKKKFDIERLMKVSVDDWKDTRDYGISHTIKMMRLRASSNNKQLYKISTHKGLLDDYDGETGSEIPDYIIYSIDQKKERI